MYITRNSNLFYELQVIAKVANVALNFLMCIQFCEMTRSITNTIISLKSFIFFEDYIHWDPKIAQVLCYDKKYCVT